MDSGCGRTIAKPKAFKGMKMRKSVNVGRSVRTSNGARIQDQGQITVVRKDSRRNILKVVAQVPDVTRNLASVMERLDTRSWVTPQGSRIHAVDEA